MKKKNEINSILENCSMELEAANEHNLVDLPYNIFTKVRPFLKLEDEEMVAEIICEEINRVI